MGIVINVEPIDVAINGTVVWFQGDPSASTEWDTLMGLNVGYKNTKERVQKLEALTEALAALTNSPDDAETLRKLIGPDVGVVTLKRVALGYIEAVTGFPTQPSSTSKKR